LENVEGLLSTNLRIETGSRKRAELLVLQMLAFEDELAHLPRSLIAAIWTALERIDSLDFSAPARAAESQ